MSSKLVSHTSLFLFGTSAAASWLCAGKLCHDMHQQLFQQLGHPPIPQSSGNNQSNNNHNNNHNNKIVSGTQWTFQHRHEFVAGTLVGLTGTTLATLLQPRRLVLAWTGVASGAVGLLLVGWVYPELKMRPTTHYSAYLPAKQASQLLSPKDDVYVTDYGGQLRAFPRHQLQRSLVVRIKGNNNDSHDDTTPPLPPATLAYCGRSGTAALWQTPNHTRILEQRLLPVSAGPVRPGRSAQRRSNQQLSFSMERLRQVAWDGALLLLDQVTGDVGWALILPQSTKNNNKPVALWQMSLESFVQQYPDGHVYVHNARELDTSTRAATLNDEVLDVLLSFVQGKQEEQPYVPSHYAVSTPLLSPSARVWGWEIEGDAVAVTLPNPQQAPHKLQSMTIGGQLVLVSYEVDQVHVWTIAPERTSELQALLPKIKGVDHRTGRLILSDKTRAREKVEPQQLERVPSVKNGIFWAAWLAFYPNTRLNPKS